MKPSRRLFWWLRKVSMTCLKSLIIRWPGHAQGKLTISKQSHIQSFLSTYGRSCLPRWTSLLKFLSEHFHISETTPGCGEYSDIRMYSNIFRYEYSFVSYSYHFFDANIFGYSFVLLFCYEYIRIFVRIVFWYKCSREKSKVCANRSKR